MKSVSGWMVGIALMVGVAAGCSPNEAATAKCVASKDCSTCCNQNGASGHASGTVNGVYSCKCLGTK
jgi:hypothetical protein